MALPSNDTLTIDFTLDYDGGKFKVKDTFDFTTNNIPLADCVGLAKITSPSGDVVYDNTDYASPDIDHDTSLESSLIAITGALDQVTSELLPGEYKVLYKLRFNYNASAVAIGEVQPSSGAELGAYKIELENADHSYLEIGDSITITGSAANNGTYVLVDVNYDGTDTFVFVAESLAPSADDTGVAEWDINKDYQKEFEYCLNWTRPVVDLQVSHDCDYLKLIGKDATDRSGDTLLTRTMKIVYPQDVNGDEVEDPVTTTSITDHTLTATNLYTKTYNFVMTSTNKSVETDGLIILFDLKGTQSHTVTCNANLVGLDACLKKLYNQYKSDCVASGHSSLACTVQQIDNLMHLVDIDKAKGDKDAVDAHILEIKELVECEGFDCDCTVADDYPVKVTSTVFTWSDPSKQDKLTVGTEGQFMQWQSGVLVPVTLDLGNYIVNYQQSFNLPTEVTAFELPANFFAEDGDGVEFEYSIRNTSGAYSTAVRYGATDYAELSIGAVSQGSARGSIVRSGTDLLVYHVSDHPAILIASGTIPGIDFTIANYLQVYMNNGTTGSMVGLIVRKLKLIS